MEPLYLVAVVHLSHVLHAKVSDTLKAIQFNKKSLLENHHTSLAQGLFYDDDANFLMTLSESEANIVRTVSIYSSYIAMYTVSSYIECICVAM